MKIKKGDTVKILYGKYKGKRGNVIMTLPKSQMVLVEGVNIYKRHVKGDGKKVQSAIIDITKPMPVSKVQLICPDTNKPTRVKYEIEDGKKYRVSLASGKRIDEKVVSSSKKKELANKDEKGKEKSAAIDKKESEVKSKTKGSEKSKEVSKEKKTVKKSDSKKDKK